MLAEAMVGSEALEDMVMAWSARPKVTVVSIPVFIGVSAYKNKL
jgi:hypothetical protein